MIIGIDIDDTITDSYEPCFAYAQLYTINILKKKIKINNSPIKHHTYLREIHNWTVDEENEFWDKYYEKLIYMIKPYTLAPETINKLKDEGNKIILITARWQIDKFDVKKATEKWLQDNNIKYDELITDASDKAKIAVEKKLDLFIDDSFKNCANVANEGIKTFIMEIRTNKGLDVDNVTRVYSWPDIYEKITNMKKGSI